MTLFSEEMQRLEEAAEIYEYGWSEQYIRLQHLHDEALQIPRLRHAGEDGMVSAVASLLHQPDVP